MDNDGLKRREDWDLLARVDENVKAIKGILDEYPPAVLSTKIENSCCEINKVDKKIENHVKSHTAFWYSVVIPVAVSLMGMAFILWRR